MKNTKYYLAVLLLIMQPIYIISSQENKNSNQQLSRYHRFNPASKINTFEPEKLTTICLETVNTWDDTSQPMKLGEWYKKQIIKTMNDDKDINLDPFSNIYPKKVPANLFKECLECCKLPGDCLGCSPYCKDIDYNDPKNYEDIKGLVLRATDKKHSMEYLKFLVEDVGLRVTTNIVQVIDMPDKNQETPLLASLNKPLDQVKFIVEHFPKRDYQEHLSTLDLAQPHLFASYSDAVVGYLIDVGYAVNSSNPQHSENATILFCEDWESDEEIIRISNDRLKFLQSKGLDINKKRNSDGNAALHTSVLCDNHPTTEQLITCKANINIQNKLGKTPLHLVVEDKEYDHTESIQKLILAGADIHKRTLPTHGSHTAIELVTLPENSQAYYQALEARQELLHQQNECLIMAQEDINISKNNKRKHSALTHNALILPEKK